MKFIILITFLILIPLVLAETTFFDNPNDFFIMNNPATGGVTGGTTGQATGGVTGGGCIYKWNCADWGECLPSGKQIRNCVNIGNCPDTYQTPETEKNCSYTTSESDGEENGKEEINKAIIFFITALAILFIILYLKKDYFKKLIKK